MKLLNILSVIVGARLNKDCATRNRLSVLFFDVLCILSISFPLYRLEGEVSSNAMLLVLASPTEDSLGRKVFPDVRPLECRCLIQIYGF
jgi:hypothetical protein